MAGGGGDMVTLPTLFSLCGWIAGLCRNDEAVGGAREGCLDGRRPVPAVWS